jgi:hypothetical protein
VGGDWWLVVREDETRRRSWHACRSFAAAVLSDAGSRAKRAKHVVEAEKLGEEGTTVPCDFRVDESPLAQFGVFAQSARDTPRFVFRLRAHFPPGRKKSP